MTWPVVGLLEHMYDLFMEEVSADPTADPTAAADAAWDERAATALSERMAVLAGQLNLVNAQVTDVVAEALERGLWRQGGVRTPEQFVAWQLGVSPERARDLVKVARARVDFPTVIQAFDQGELSVEQVAVAVRAPAWADDQIIDIVRISTVDKLRKQMRERNFEGDPHANPDREDHDLDRSRTDEVDAAPAPPVDVVSFGADDDGRWRIRGSFDLLTGRRIEAALTERRDALFGGDEHVTWADAFTDCFERSLDAVESPSRSDRFRTWIHLDVTQGTATTTDGWRIPMTLADHVLCDGIVQPVWESDGVPFSVGRSHRIVPDRTRRIVERRDRGCRVPGCTAERFVEIHHIVHWLDGGATDTSNLVSLCPQHHRQHHQGGLGIAGDADSEHGLTFTDWAGKVIGPNGQPVPPAEPPPEAPHPYTPPLRGPIRRQGEWVHPNVLARRAEAARRVGRDRRAA
jgi:hypothetical protein